jgi:hypothetical protein
VVVKPDKEEIFKKSKEGLYYHKTADRTVILVNTLKENKGFTEHEYEQATNARQALGLVGHPSTKYFKNMVRSNMIKNCAIKNADINNATIYWPRPRNSKRENSVMATRACYDGICDHSKGNHGTEKKVTLASDFMFVNGLGFIVSISRKIKFTAAAYIPTRKQHILVKYLKKIFNIYKYRGFVIDTALMYREFECL